METTQKIVALKLPEMERKLVASKKPTSSDLTWYNLYSDGWVEQGGFNRITMAVNGADTVLTLPVVMSTSDYAIVLTLSGTYGSRTLSAQGGKATTTTITVGGYVPSGSEYNSCFWQVSGYAAESEYIDKIIRKEFIAY